MNQTKIQLIGPNSGFLDLKENTVAPLTFAVADIKDISKKKGTFSKSITLAGSKNNNILLGNYFDVNIQAGTFDVNKIVECNIIQNGVPVLSNGILQLVAVNKNQKDSNHEDEITYTVLVKDNTSDFFTQINNKELTDLSGFTWMNHVYTADVVIDSFDNTITDGYKYIMPYTPEGQQTVDDTSLDLTEFSPGIYAKIYFDKIFQAAGYSYSWPDMDSSNVNFSKLIIPFNGEKPIVNAVEVIDYTSEVENSASQTISTRTQIINNIAGSSRYEITQSTTDRVNMTVEISDPTNRWNSLFSRYNPPNLPSNQNSIEIEYDVDWELISNSFGTAYLMNYNTSSSLKFNVFPTIKMRRAGTAQYLASTNILDTDGNFFKFSKGMFIPNGVSVLKSGTSTFTQLAQGIDPAFDIEVCSNVSTSGGWMFKSANNIASTNRTSTSFGLRITGIRVKIKTMVEGTYGYNIPIDMNRYVPQKVKQSDFIKSIFTMFNIFAEVDKDNPKRINLVSRDKYYDEGAIKDWSKKLDKKQPQEIKFLPEISSKSMLLTYKEDSDISNKIYKEATGEIYGQQKFTFDNEFVKEEKKTEIIFSPTPMFNTKFGAVCPMWLGGSPKCNLRILYDGGEQPCDTYAIVNYKLQSGSVNQVSGTTYPYVGHWDKPDNPSFDLNFGVCDYYFRSDDFGALTNNNLFNLHWRRTLNQINTGKIMTAYFNLNESDILNLKLNDKIRIDNSWWNINKVQDYDANSNKPTKVELVSIDDNLKIPFQTRRIKTIKDLSTDLIAIPIRTLTKERDKFLTVNLSPYDIEVRGKYNYITADVTSATVVGNGNLISANSQVYGDNNTIAAESTVTGDNNVVTEDGGGSIVNGNEVTITVPNSDNNTPITSSSVNYVRGWQGERENGNSINIGKAQGRVLLTNGSNMITGINTLFSNSDNDGLDNTYEITVFDSDGTPRFFRVSNYTGDTIADIFEIYSDNQYINSLGSTWTGATGEYDWYSYMIPQANGIRSTAMGSNTKVNGNYSTAFGNYAQANGSYSTAFGNYTQANGQISTAFGNYTQANGQISTAFGNFTKANGIYSVAMGSSSIANSQWSTAMGAGTQANGVASTAMGDGTLANTISEVALGSYNENITGSTGTTVSTDRIFSIGIGTSSINRRDGFRFYKNGAAYLYPSPLSGVTNGAAGFMKMDENSKLNIHNGSSWNEVALNSDLLNYVKLSGDQSISGVKTFEAIDLVAADSFQLRGGDGRFTININENPFFEVSSGDGYMFWMNSSGDRALFDNNALTSDRTYNLPNASGTFALTSDIPSLTGYVTTNTTQTITGKKTFDDVNRIKKITTHSYPTNSGGNFFIGGTGGYDIFEFYSLDGSDQDSFGSSQIYSNPEEGNYIYHTSLDGQINAVLRVNQYDTYLRNIFGGQQTSLYVNGQTDKITIEGTQNRFANLGTSLITGSKNFEFPNESGTIALLSNLVDTYITGGTYSNGTITLTNNTGGTVSITGLPVFPTTGTGVTVAFNAPIIYNTASSFGTGNFAENLTGARVGIVQKIYHKQGTAPTFPAGWVKISGNYSTSLLNIIYAEWCGGSRVEYWIINV